MFKVNQLGKKLLLALMVLPSTNVGATEVTAQSDAEEALKKGQMVLLSPSQSITFNHKLSKIRIDYARLEQILSGIGGDLNGKQIGVSFHDESDNLDFSTLDGVAFRVTLDAVSGTPPNGIMAFEKR